jgi:hypothetical protein
MESDVGAADERLRPRGLDVMSVQKRLETVVNYAPRE